MRLENSLGQVAAMKAIASHADLTSRFFKSSTERAAITSLTSKISLRSCQEASCLATRPGKVLQEGEQLLAALPRGIPQLSALLYDESV